MYSFLYFFTEDRIEFLKKTNPEISTEHDRLASKTSSSDIIDHFAANDPDSKKRNTGWVVNQYKKGHIRQEDTGRIKSTLENFETHKTKLQNKDINSYKHIDDLENAIEPHLGSDYRSNKQVKADIKHKGSELVHDSNGIQLYKIKTKEAACHYGAGTKWCTNSMTDPKEPFHQYTNPEKSDDPHTTGNLYMLKLPTGKKYQLHHQRGEFKDESDNDVDMNDLYNDHPDLYDVKELNKEHKKVINGPNGMSLFDHPLTTERQQNKLLNR